MATQIRNKNGGHELRIQRYLNAAESFLKAKNFDDCRKNAFLAQALDPIHPGPTHLFAIAAVISAATTDRGSCQRSDFYSIIGVPRFTGDLQLIKTRYEKLCALLNPRENHYALAEEAYQLVTKAWLVLSVPSQRALFDEELKTWSFWTMCPYYYYVYEYPMVFKECCMRCQNGKCRRAFHGVVIPPPPTEVAEMGKFICPGFMAAVRVEGGGGNGMDSWTPFATVGLGANGEHGDKVKFPNQAFGGMEIDNEKGIDKVANDGNVGMKQKMAAKGTQKLMGKGVRIDVDFEL